MKQQLIAAYRTASARFTSIIRSKYKQQGIEEVLVPTQRHKTAVCIIMNSGVYIFQPSQEYHKTRKDLSKPRTGRKPITQEEHEYQCDRVIDIIMREYHKMAQARVNCRPRVLKSKWITDKEEAMYVERARRSRQPV